MKHQRELMSRANQPTLFEHMNAIATPRACREARVCVV